MKVLQVITKGEAGGAQTHLLELCRALDEQVSFTVVIGGPAEDSALAQRLTKLGIKPHYQPQIANSVSPWRIFLAVRAFTKLLRQQRPELIHAHSGMAGAVARIAGLLTRTPVVYTVHGFGFKPQVPRPQRLAAHLVEWLLAPFTNHMICVSEHERALAMRLPLAKHRISVVHNALHDLPHQAAPGTEPMRVIMVARCAPPKRQDLLLSALSHISIRLGREIPTTLVGGGPQLTTLQTQAALLGLKQVTFTGDIGNVPELLAQHQLFVLVSDHEGLPISIIEALRCGLPIVGSDLPGICELIEGDAQGRIIQNDVEFLAQALIDLAAQPETRARMGLAARRRFEREHMLEEMARANFMVYAQILHHE